MSEQDPEELLGELEQEADRLERHSAEVGRQVQDSRQEWKTKRADENIPGARPLEGEDSPAGAEEEPRSEARRED
jgi:hypothetical protein